MTFGGLLAPPWAPPMSAETCWVFLLPPSRPGLSGLTVQGTHLSLFVFETFVTFHFLSC